MKALVLLGIATSLLGSATRVTAQADAAVPCSSTFDSLRSAFEHDYAAYPGTALALGGALARTTQQTERATAQANGWLACVKAIHRWTALFHDSHLAFYYTGPPKPAPPAGPAGAALTRPDTMARPAMRFPDNHTAIITLPDLAWQWKPVVDSLVAANRELFEQAPDWVIDLRGDGGGCTCTFDILAPYLYAAPIRIAGADARSSLDNIAWYRSWLADSTFPAADKPQVREVVARMAARPGEFVTWEADSTIAPVVGVPHPRRIVILVDDGCASSCEDIVLAARQSPSVTIMGKKNTAGAEGFGNIHMFMLPGYFRVHMATTRDHPGEGAPVAFVGIAPGVMIPGGERDELAFALRWLAKATAPARRP